MRTCRFNKQATCYKKGKRTKVDCLQCILARTERAYAKLLHIISLDVKVSIGEAGYVYELLKCIFTNSEEFTKWIAKYYPDKLIPPLPQPNIETELKRFSNSGAEEIYR